MAPEPEAQPAAVAHAIASAQLQNVFEIVADLPGLTDAERQLRRQNVAGIVMAMKPRDPLEMMLAGQCIIFDHLLNTAVLDLSPDRPEPARTKARPGIVAAARMFHNSLNALRRAQSGTAEKTSRPREVIQAVEPRTVAPAPAAAKPPTPRFVCQRVHIPRQREASNDVRFGAMYRPPNSQIRNMSRTTQSGLLNGASRIAMPIPSAAKRALSLDELPLSILEPTLSREQRRARPAPRKRR